MLGIDRRAVQNFDWGLFGLVFVLVTLGIVNLISATHEAEVAGWSSQVHRQLFAVGLGCAGLLFVLVFDYRHLERFAIPLFIACLLLVLSTLIFGPVIKGNQSWLVLGPMLEENFRRAMVLSEGNWLVFVQRPISLGFLLLAAALLLATALPNVRRKREEAFRE